MAGTFSGWAQAAPAPGAIWDEAARHFDEPALAALILSIAMCNGFNRLNVAIRQVAGERDPLFAVLDSDRDIYIIGTSWAASEFGLPALGRDTERNTRRWTVTLSALC